MIRSAHPASTHPSEAFSRRKFLGGALAAGGATVLLDHWFAKGLAAAAPIGPNDGCLVVIALDGGCDSLDTVRPVSSSSGVGLVHDARTTLGQATGLALDGDWALHPALTTLQNEWHAGRVAIVHGFGDTQFAELSHFKAIDIHMHGQGGSAIGSTGWLGRYLDPLPPSTLAGIHLGTSVPLELTGQQRSGVALPLSMSNVGTSSAPDEVRLEQAIRSFATVPTGLGAMADAWATSAVVALDVAGQVQPAYPAGSKGSLVEVTTAAAELLNLDIGVRAVTLVQGGYDFHANLRPGQDQLLAELDAAVGALLATLEPAMRDRTTVLIHSEFGRRLAENTSAGTDHGEGGVAFVIGSKVAGGHHGDAPSLLPSALHWGNLAPTTDFRRVFAGLVEDWLGGDANAVIGSGYSAQKLHLFSSGPGA